MFNNKDGARFATYYVWFVSNNGVVSIAEEGDVLLILITCKPGRDMEL